MQNICTKADIEPQQFNIHKRGATTYLLATNACGSSQIMVFEHFISPRIWYINPGVCDTRFFQKCQSPNNFDETEN